MSTIRYLLDEHVPQLFRSALLRREPTLIVWMVGAAGAPPKGTLDPELLRWCETNEFFLITNNRKSMSRHLQDHLDEGRHVPGILVLSQNMRIGETIDELLLISGASQEGEYQDRIAYLPVT
jgi:hypothetical protein